LLPNVRRLKKLRPPVPRKLLLKKQPQRRLQRPNAQRRKPVRQQLPLRLPRHRLWCARSRFSFRACRINAGLIKQG
jgi:hypothetical protein